MLFLIDSSPKLTFRPHIPGGDWGPEYLHYLNNDTEVGVKISGDFGGKQKKSVNLI